jgi:hypothetical protein
MQLKKPFIITPRLLPGLQIGGAFISIEYDGAASGRALYRYHIDLPDGTEHSAADLRSGVGGGSLQSGVESLLSFLGAAAESYDYRLRTNRKGENEDLFPPAITEWAALYSDEISMVQTEIEETPGLIQE